MKITCNTSILADACNIVQRGVSQKSTIPATEGIYMQAKNSRLTLSGYDLEVGSVVSLQSEVYEEGRVVLNAKNLCDIFGVSIDDMLKENDDHKTKISKIMFGI